MALTRNGNTLYIPSGESATDYVPTSNSTLLVYGIILTPDSATVGTLLLFNGGGSVKKADFKTGTAQETTVIRLFEFPLIFPSGIRVTTTDCVATLMLAQAGA